MIMDNEVLKNSENRSGQKYAELLCDFMFKRLFGSEENKDVLIYFLNMVMKDVEIDDVDFIPTEHLGLTEEDRKVIFDILCKCKSGRSFRKNHRYFRWNVRLSQFFKEKRKNNSKTIDFIFKTCYNT